MANPPKFSGPGAYLPEKIRPLVRGYCMLDVQNSKAMRDHKGTPPKIESATR